MGTRLKDLDQTGVIQVDGAWATSVKYAADALGTNTGSVQLRFMQGRAQVGQVSVTREQLGELLGEKNSSAIERHIANDADKYLAIVSGELRGRRLHYQQVFLSTTAARANENSIAPTQTRDLNAQTKTESGRSEVREPKISDAPPNSTIGDARDDDAQRRRRANNPQGGERSAATLAPVPVHIAAKYLVKGNTYHFDDQTLAFVDKGTSLTVQTHNKAIIQDLVAIAQARDWQAVTVSGSQAFRREAWAAAASSGLTVSGYRPSEIERSALERERNRRDGIALASSAIEWVTGGSARILIAARFRRRIAKPQDGHRRTLWDFSGSRGSTVST